MSSRRGLTALPARARRAGITVLAIAIASAGLAACGSGGSAGTNTVARLAGQAKSGKRSGALSTANSDQDMLDFARCLRAHGVQVSDPYHRAGHAGLSLDIPTPTAANQHALAVCNHYVAPITAAKSAGAAQQAGAELPHLIRYARCMRAHGIAMLDPRPDGELVLGSVAGLSSSYGRNSSQFHAADSACRHLLPAGVKDDGTGP